MNTEIIELFNKLKFMPPLSNWPNRETGQFQIENSDVIKFICALDGTFTVPRAVEIFDYAKRPSVRVLLFLEDPRLWIGSQCWTPIERKPLGISEGRPKKFSHRQFIESVKKLGAPMPTCVIEEEVKKDLGMAKATFYRYWRYAVDNKRVVSEVEGDVVLWEVTKILTDEPPDSLNV